MSADSYRSKSIVEFDQIMGTSPNLTIVSGSPGQESAASARFSDAAVAELAEILTHYPTKKAAMLPALWIAQREYGGYLPPEAIREAGDRLERPYPEAEGAATFFTVANVRPPVRAQL